MTCDRCGGDVTTTQLVHHNGRNYALGYECGCMHWWFFDLTADWKVNR